MNMLFILFIAPYYIKIKNELTNKFIKLPVWHNPNIKCYNDEDCPIPYACCHDAFFPMKDNYCCINYKNRDYKYSYVYNLIKK
jgi:hypothetical protein